MNSRRRMIMLQQTGISPNTPYTSGLALHLDAIDNTGGNGHDATYMDWKDKTSNAYEFIQYPTDSKKAFNNNYFDFDNSHYFMLTGSTRSWKTVEIVLSDVSGGTTCVFQTAATGQNPIGTVSTKSNAVLFHAGGAKSVAKQDGIHTYACDGTNVYVDGVVQSPANVTISLSGLTNWRVGGYASGSYKAVCNVHAIRCYDKVLTADEIAFNASIDRVRFQ